MGSDEAGLPKSLPLVLFLYPWPQVSIPALTPATQAWL